MLRMNKEEARQELVARQSVLKNFNAMSNGYNTGTTLIAANAVEYIGYYQSKTFGGLSTGAIGACVNEVKWAYPVAIIKQNILTPSEMVAVVRKTFTLSVSNAASVFKVSRPTIYQWETLNDIELIRAHNDRDRIKHLYRLAQIWAKRGQLTGRWLDKTLGSGQSVLDLLTADQIDLAAIVEAHDHLVAADGVLNQAEHARSVSAIQSIKGAFNTLAEKESVRRKENL